MRVVGTVNTGSSTTLSQCSTLELEEAQNSLERSEKETLMDGVENNLDLLRYSSNATMMKHPIKAEFCEEDAHLAL